MAKARPPMPPPAMAMVKGFPLEEVEGERVAILVKSGWETVGDSLRDGRRKEMLDAVQKMNL